MLVGEILKAGRKQRGYTQAVASGLVGISDRTLRRYENSEILPDDPTIHLLAELLKLDATYLIHRCELNRGIIPNDENFS